MRARGVDRSRRATPRGFRAGGVAADARVAYDAASRPRERGRPRCPSSRPHRARLRGVAATAPAHRVPRHPLRGAAGRGAAPARRPRRRRAGAARATPRASAPRRRSAQDPLVGALGLLHGARSDEDCLTLNVFTPAATRAARPVLVWLPGGAFIGGTACVPLYDGRAPRRARRRRGGDAQLPRRRARLQLRAGAPGDARVANLGLQDQIAALRWVRAHVAAFGGDPARVTVFGESAGAGSILALAGMPAARGLFASRDRAERGAARRAHGRRRRARARGAVLAKLGLAGPRRRRAARGAARRAARGAVRLRAPRGRTEPECSTRRCSTAARCVGALPTPSPSGFAAELPLLIGTTRDEMRLYASGQPDAEEVVRRIVAPQLDWLSEPERADAAAALIDGPPRRARARAASRARLPTSSSRSRPICRCATTPRASPRRARRRATPGCTCSPGVARCAAVCSAPATRSICPSPSAISMRPGMAEFAGGGGGGNAARRAD